MPQPTTRGIAAHVPIVLGAPPRRLRPGLLAATMLAVAAYLGLAVAHARGGGEAVQHALYLAMGAGGTLACVARVALVRADRAAWACVSAAALFWLAGDVMWTASAQATSYPWAADVVYLASYPLLAVALGLLLGGRRDRTAAHLWLDGAIGGLALGALVTAVLFRPVLDAAGVGAARTVVDFAYPICDLALLGVGVAALGARAWRPGRDWGLLTAGACMLALADATYLYEVATDTYRAGAAASILWPASLLCWGWAAWQPARPARRWADVPSGTFLYPAAFSLLALGVLLLGQARDVPLTGSLLAGGALVLATIRAGSNHRQSMHLLAASRREARTDGLTGLRNRRALLDDLEAALAAGASSAPCTLAFYDLDGFKAYNDRFGHGEGDALLRRLGAALRDALGAHGTAYRLGGDEFCALVDGARVPEHELLRRCRSALAAHVDGVGVTASQGLAVLPAEALDVGAALALADQRMYGMKDDRRTAARHQASALLLQVLREREPDVHEHSDGVAELCLAVGRRLGLDGDALDELARAAELHDVGKLVLPEAVLHKPGPLDESEWQLMRQHTIVGARILSVSPAMLPIAAIVRASHERWDGGGYPDRLAGAAIPLGARIVAVCDTYSAMTSARPYKPALDHAVAVAELRRCAGTQFDPGVVETFCAALAAGEISPAPALRATSAAALR